MPICGGHQRHVLLEPLRRGFHRCHLGCAHYEKGLAVANGGYLLPRSRFIGVGLPANWTTSDIVSVTNNRLAENQTSCKARQQRKYPQVAEPCSTARSALDELLLAIVDRRPSRKTAYV